jgi:peptide/nickel transport system substrate-binding protein
MKGLIARRSVLPVLTSAVVACGGGDTATLDLSALPPFCQEVLPRVAAFMDGFEHPTGEQYGGTAVLGAIGEMPDGMNALVSTNYDGAQAQENVNLMTLVRFNEQLQFVPYLAESWEVNADNTELTFRIRNDVYWHDGTRTSAYDVEFTYLRATDPETAFPNAAYWTRYVTGDQGIDVVDSTTVVVRMQPHAEFLDPWRALPIMPEHLLGDTPPAELRQHPYGMLCPVGNGPFVFERHEDNALWSFTRNPAFPEALGGPPYLERYVFRIIPEMTTLLTELLTGAIDFYEAPGPDQVEQIEESAELEVRDFEFRGYDLVGWNERRPQLADARVRRAITLATNRDEILTVIRRGYGVIANSGVPPFHWAYMPELADSLRYNPEQAAALLDEAGWVDRNGDGVRENEAGDRLEIVIKYNLGNQQREDIAQIMQAQLALVGIAVTPQVVEWGTLLEQINSPEQRDFDGVVIGWVTDFKINDHDLFHSRAIDEPFGWSGTHDPEMDRLIDTLQVVVDRAEALPLWKEYQNRLVAVQPYTYLYHVQRLAGLNRRLQGVTLDARGELASIRDWWIPADQR